MYTERVPFPLNTSLYHLRAIPETYLRFARSANDLLHRENALRKFPRAPTRWSCKQANVHRAITGIARFVIAGFEASKSKSESSGLQEAPRCLPRADLTAAHAPDTFRLVTTAASAEQLAWGRNPTASALPP